MDIITLNEKLCRIVDVREFIYYSMTRKILVFIQTFLSSFQPFLSLFLSILKHPYRSLQFAYSKYVFDVLYVRTFVRLG